MDDAKSMRAVSIDGVFRTEVLRARADSWLGPMRILPPPLAKISLVFALIIVVSMLAIISTASYTRHAQADGAIISATGVVAIMPSMDGVISRIYVRDGQHVRKGQLLFELSSEETSLDGGESRASRVAILKAKQSTLQADLAAQADAKAASLRDLRAQLASREQQSSQLADQIQIQVKRTEAAQQLYDQWTRLGNTGVVSKAQILQQRDVVLQGQSNESQLRGQRSKLSEDLIVSRSALARFEDDFAATARKLQRDKADVDAELATALLDLGSVARSTIDGTVTTVLVHPGQRTTKQDAALSLVPTDQSVLAEIWMASSAVGFVAPGQMVNLKYQAFPFRTFGVHHGHVVEVSQVALNPAEVSRILGRTVDDSRYRVLVKLDRQTIDALGGPRPLKVGMQLEGDVLLGHRRLLDWLIDPTDGRRSSDGQVESSAAERS